MDVYDEMYDPTQSASAESAGCSVTEENDKTTNHAPGTGNVTFDYVSGSAFKCHRLSILQNFCLQLV
jgi:hypothetical protein